LNASEILRLREQTCLSQEKFGELVGVSGAAVSYWESGTTSPRPEHEIAIRRVSQECIDLLRQYRKSLNPEIG